MDRKSSAWRIYMKRVNVTRRRVVVAAAAAADVYVYVCMCVIVAR